MERLFYQLLKEKRRFLFSVIPFLIIFYFSLPLTIAFFPDQMNNSPPFINLPWSWLYAFAQFLVTWLLGLVYWQKAKRYDQLVEQMKQEDIR